MTIEEWYENLGKKTKVPTGMATFFKENILTETNKEKRLENSKKLLEFLDAAFQQWKIVSDSQALIKIILYETLRLNIEDETENTQQKEK